MALVLLASAAALGADTREDAARRLETKVAVDFRGIPLSKAVETFRALTGLNFVVEEGGELPVRLTVRDLSAKSALRLLLQPLGFSASFQGGAVILRRRRAEEVSVRIYTVRSKLAKLRDFRSDRLGFGRPDGSLPKVDFVILTLNLEICCFAGESFIIDLVRENTGGCSWDQDPRVCLHLVEDRLFISQTAAVHREIAALLERIPNRPGEP